MGDLDTTVQASLGQLAVTRGVISEAARERLARDLLECARAGKPRSLARLLLQGGFTAQAVQELLLHGASIPSVRCDACGEAISQQKLRKREEVPCARCGSLVLGFAAYSRDPSEAASEVDDDTKRMGPEDPTEKWRSVLPTPPPRESAGTERWKGVVPLPPRPDDGKGGTPPGGVPTRTPAGGGGRAPRNTTPVDDPTGRTIVFDRVLPKPTDSTMKLFPAEGGAAARGDAPAGPNTPGSKPSPFDDRGRVDPDRPLGSDEVDRTIGFGDVFLLPGRSVPRTDAEVTSEMNTLLGMTPLALPPRTATPVPKTPPMGIPRRPSAPTPPVPPTPLVRFSESAHDPGLVPPDFDPGGVTAPMSRNEIAAALAQGPPSTPAEPIPESDDVQLTMTPAYAAPPSAASDANPKAPKRTTTKKKREEPKAGRGVSLYLLLVLALLGGVAAAAMYWAKTTGRL